MFRRFVDGEQVAERENAFWHQPLDVTLSMGLRPPLGYEPSRGGFPTTMQVDYIRVWQQSPTP